MAVKDRSCKHIFIAAWQRPPYFCMLKDAKDKTMIVEGAAIKEGYDMFNLPALFTTFPEVFRASTAHTSDSTRTYLRAVENGADSINQERPAVSKVHYPQVNTVSVLTRSQHLVSVSSEAAPKPEPASRSESAQKQGRVNGILPIRRYAVPGYIPLNNNDERLDLYSHNPLAEDFGEYHSLV